jgi:hypothetical protein
LANVGSCWIFAVVLVLFLVVWLAVVVFVVGAQRAQVATTTRRRR